MKKHLTLLTLFTLIPVHSFASTSRSLSRSACENWIGSSEKREVILEQVEKAVRKTGQKLLALRESGTIETRTKSHLSDLKTQGDCLSQQDIILALAGHSATQNANFIAEEECTLTHDIIANKKTGTQALWILDPIDGTTNFAHGMPHFSISLALMVDNTLCFGAVYAPVNHELFYAFTGYGAFLKSSPETTAIPISVSKIEELQQSLWITGTEGGPKSVSVDKNRKTFEIAQELLPQTHDLRRTGSAALDMASVASGRVEAYFELSDSLNWWDIAAGMVLVTEAGGKVTVREKESNKVFLQNTVNSDKPIDYVLATNGKSKIQNGFKKAIEKHFANPQSSR